MIDFTQASVNEVIVHQVGNKLRGEGYSFSKELLKLEDTTITSLLTQYLLSPFSKNEFYNFSHPTDLKHNELFCHVEALLDSESDFIQTSISIAKRLYETSTHPKVNGGELFIVRMTECVVEDEVVDAIGVFKSEIKETYLRVRQTQSSFDFLQDKGINVKKLDKGCIVFNTDRNLGYKVAVIDNLNKKSEAQYWTNSFLSVSPANDKFHNTNNFLAITRDFVSKKLPLENKMDRSEQVDLLNKSMSFFKEHEEFDKQEFMETVFQEPEVINSFQQFEHEKSEQDEFVIPDKFQISNEAVKKKARIFKSVLKLDKNFHIYIHGDKELIEKGVDPQTGKKFYKIYFDEES